MLKTLCLIVVLAPLAGAMLAGLLGKFIGRMPAALAAILGVAVALGGSIWAGMTFFEMNTAFVNMPIYLWGQSAGISMDIGFYIDPLTLLMMCVVTFVSLMVHIYTIGYMHDDPGFQRFFSYIAFFTFAMLMLVMSNNLLQLFFGWEAVGVASYLLIGFWFKKSTATYANLKAFMVNRVGDLGFLLGIAVVFMVVGSLNYSDVFNNLPLFESKTLTLFPGVTVSLVSAACILLFIGAMGKSAQMPLHVWLPDSMEGPTPISALIHAATMVTAGVFMVARFSPLFEMSETARTFVLVIGATTALFMGFLGIVQNDIKRIIAYSTLSQLGYMMVALGVSAYAAGVFHLMTHAFFKALLFLGAGSVIMGMHHEQDIRKMGGLYRYMPITYVCMLLASLALAGIPPFAGFYSKDAIIEATALAHMPGATYAYYCVLLGVFVTALYTFRLFFLVFHTKPRMDAETKAHCHESPLVVTVPLILLAIPSVLAGGLLVKKMLFSNPNYFGSSIVVDSAHNVLAKLAGHFHGALAMALHAPMTLPFWIALAGLGTAWFCYMRDTNIPLILSQRFSVIYSILLKKYGFDTFNDWFFAKGTRVVGRFFWKVGDQRVIDGAMVNGTANLLGVAARGLRLIQTGFLNQYVLVMIMGLLGLMSWWMWG